MIDVCIPAILVCDINIFVIFFSSNNLSYGNEYEPLYIPSHFNEKTINGVLVDRASRVNVITKGVLVDSASRVNVIIKKILFINGFHKDKYGNSLVTIFTYDDLSFPNGFHYFDNLG